MNRIRKIVTIVAALALAAFALSSMAATTPDKSFSIISPPPSPNLIKAGDTKTVTITFTNVSPKQGNSVINTLTATLQNAVGATLSNPQAQSGNAALCSGNTAVCVTGLTGVKPSQTFWVKVNVTVAAGTACNAGQWFGQAWTGGGGQPFTAFPTGADTAPVYIGCDGMLASCGGTVGTDPTDPGNDIAVPGANGILRGSDTDGSCSSAIAYALNVNPSSWTYSALKGNLNPSVEYIMVWDPVSVDPDGWAGKRPWVTWTADPTSPAVAPNWAPILPCRIDDVNGTPTAVMPLIPNAAPYNDTSMYPVSSPYAYDATQATTKHMWMCSVQHGFTVDSINSDQIIYFDIVIDQIDSSGKYP